MKRINSCNTKPYIKISMLLETMFWNSVDRSNRIFKSFDTRKFIIKKEFKYFSYDFKKTTNLGKLYLYLKFISGFIMYPEDPVPHLQPWTSNRESIRISWFSFKVFNVKWLVTHSRLKTGDFQKQSPKSVPRKRCFENMLQIYRKTSMPRCEFF